MLTLMGISWWSISQPFAADRPAAAPGRAERVSLVPIPTSLRMFDGEMEVNRQARVVATDKRLHPLAGIFADEIFLATGLRLETTTEPPRPGDIALALTLPDPKAREDAYNIVVAENATVSAASYRGMALGTVTLLQALQSANDGIWLPRMAVEDWPRFSYNGVLLDLARKPYSIDVLKQCIEVCRFYKIRHILLHMSDENAWTFPSTKYPQLGSNNFAWGGGETPRVYKLDELKELVAFADARGVTLVPELEVPGHSGQLRGTLTEIFGYRDAAGKNVGLGVVNMVREEAFAALETLIGEMCDVFKSSPFFHVGCDEASLGGIEEMPEIKEFVARHKLAAPHDVFNGFVRRLNGIVKSKGKRMIVWEGAPLDPEPLPKDIIFMPWVGQSGLAARLVKDGFALINAPWGVEQPYFNPFLVNGAQLNRDEPLLFGTTSLLWESESDKAVPYLRFTGALRNEPTWNPDSERDFGDFLRRLLVTDRRLDRVLYGFAFTSSETVDPTLHKSLDPLFARPIMLTLESPFPPGQVHYTLNGSEPAAASAAYVKPIELSQTTLLKARRFLPDGTPAGETLVREYRQLPAVKHDAVAAKVTISPPKPGYFGPGPQGLADGYLAAGYDLDKPGWVGWVNDGQQLTITLDFGKLQELRRVATHFLRSAGGVTIPTAVAFAVSDDGESYRPLATVAGEQGNRQRGWFSADVEKTSARYLRVTPTPGGDWTFVDEVTVNAPPEEKPKWHAAIGKPIKLAQPPNGYTAPGVEGLTDGYVSREANFLSLEWLGFEYRPFEATVDLGEIQPIKTVGANFLQLVVGGIFIPAAVEISVSDDGQTFREVAKITRPPDNRPRYLHTLATDLKDVRGRYVKLVGRPTGSWLFVDEIFVNPEQK